MAGAAGVGTLERISSGLRGRKADGGNAFAALRHLDIDVGADDAKAVRGVVACDANLQSRAHGGLDFGWREREALRADLNHFRRRLWSREQQHSQIEAAPVTGD